MVHGETRKKVLAHIWSIANNYKNQDRCCRAGNGYFSGILGISIQQVSKHIQKLKEDGLIAVKYSKPKFDNGKYFQTRSIYVLFENTVKTYELYLIVKEYFDNKKKLLEEGEELIGEVEENLPFNDYVDSVKEMIGSEAPKPVESEEKADCDIIKEIDEYELYDSRKHVFFPDLGELKPQTEVYFPNLGSNKEELSDTQMTLEQKQNYERALEEEKVERKKARIYDLSKERISLIWPKERFDELRGNDDFEKLIHAIMLQYKEEYIKNQNLGLKELITEPNPEYISIENGEYFYEIGVTFDNRGKYINLVYKVKLFDYVPWDNNSQEFKDLIIKYESLKKEKDEFTQESQVGS